MSTKRSKESFFWTSYSDLMTSMFFVMLVLFVMAIALLHHKVVEIQGLYNDVKVQNEQYEKILQLETQFEELGKSSELQYIEEKKMFVVKDFMGVEIFQPERAEIKPEYIEIVDKVGKSLQNIIKRLYVSNSNLSFQLVIEGNAAIPWQQKMTKTYNPDNTDMYELSYRRALALYQRWQSIGVNLRGYNTEVIIAGSGFNGVNRDT